MKHLGRKIYHLLGGLGLLSLYYLLGREQALLCYAVLFVVVLSFDLARLKIPAFNSFVLTTFPSFIRESEAHKLTGTPAYVLGIGLTLFLYRTDLAALAICFLAFGDVAATTIGERYGKTKIGPKSLEGSIAFVAASVAAGFLLLLTGVITTPIWLILIGAIIAACIELLPIQVNDNLVIPLASGGAMSLLCWIFGCG